VSGGITGFQENIDLMFCTSTYDGYERLDVAAIVRRSTDLPPFPPDPAYVQPPPQATSGGGASIGPFYVSFFLPQRVLRVNGVTLVTLAEDQNVALLAEVDGELVLHGIESVSPELDLSIGDPAAFGASIVERMREVLSKASKVKDFIEQPRP
jgi:hypothetical protein